MTNIWSPANPLNPDSQDALSFEVPCCGHGFWELQEKMLSKPTVERHFSFELTLQAGLPSGPGVPDTCQSTGSLRECASRLATPSRTLLLLGTSWISSAVIRHHIQRQREKETIVCTLGLAIHPLGNSEQEPGGRNRSRNPVGMLLTDLFSMANSASFLIPSRTTCVGMP